MADNFEQVLKNLEAALLVNPADTWMRVRLGRLYLQIGRVADATSAFEQAIRKDPLMADAHHGMGRVQAIQGDVKAAVETYHRVLQLDSNHVGAHSDLAAHYDQQNDDLQARSHYQALLLAKPDDLEILRKCSDFSWRHERYEEVTSLLERTRQLATGDSFVQLRLGLAYVRLEKHSLARDVLAQACASDEAPFEAIAALALSCARLGDPKNAAIHWRRSLSLDASHCEARLGLSGCLLELEQPEKALDELSKLQSSDAQRTDARILIGRALVAVQRYADALEVLLAAQRDGTAEPEVYRLSGQAEQALGRIEAAITQFERALRYDPESFATLVMLADARIAVGHHDAAIQVLQTTLELKPDEPDLHQKLATQFLAVGHVQRALESFAKAAALNPSNAKARWHAGECAARLEHFGDAEQWLAQAVSLEPGLAEAHLLRGEVLVRLGRAKDAVTSLQDAARLTPADPSASLSLAHCLLELHRDAQAVDVLTAASVQHPQDAPTIALLGRGLSRLRRFEQAAEVLRQAVALDGQDIMSALDLGLALEAIGETTQAKEALGNATNLDRSSIPALHALGRVCLKLGDWSEGVSALEQAHRLSGNTEATDRSVLLGRGYRLLGRLDDARSVLETVARRARDNSQAQYELGLTLVGLNLAEQSQQYFELTVELSTTHVDACFQLGLLALRAGKPTAAIEWHKRVVSLEPNHVEAYRQIAAAATLGDNWQEVVAALQQVLRCEPNDVATLSQLATAYEALGRDRDARDSLAALLRLSPQWPDGELRLGLVLARLGEDAPAVDLLQRSLSDDRTRLVHFDVLVDCLDRLAQSSKVIEALERAVQIDDQSGPRWQRLGHAYSANSQVAEAIRAFEKALANGVADCDTNNKLGAMYRSAGRQAIEQDSHATALGHFLNAQRFQVDDPELLRELAICHRATGDLAKAADAAKRATLLDRRRLELPMLLGGICAEMGDLNGAQSAFRDAVSIDSTSFEAIRELGLLLRKQGLNREAIEALTRAVQMRPAAIDIHAELGWTLFDEGRFQEAIVNLEQVVTARPLDAQANRKLAICWRELKQDSNALETFERVLTQLPNDPEALWDIGQAQIRLARLSEALVTLRHLTEVTPASAKAYAALGKCLFDTQQTGATISALSKSVELDPQPTILWILHQALFLEKHYAESIEVAQRVLAHDAKHSQCLELLSEALLALGRETQAIEALEQLLAIDANHRQANRRLTEIYTQRAAHCTADSPARALENLELALKYSPNDPSLDCLKARCQWRLTQPQNALDTVRAGTKKDPSHLPSWLLLGELYRTGGFGRESVEAYRKALALSPDSFEAKFGLAWALEGLEELERAEEMFAQAAELQNDSIEAREHRAEILFELGRKDESAAEWAHVGRLRELTAEESRKVGLLFASLADYANAATLLDCAIARFPEDTDCLFQLAVCHEAAQNWTSAIPILERLTDVAPMHPKGWSKLGLARARAGAHVDSAIALRRALQDEPQSVLLLRELALQLAAVNDDSGRAEILELLTRLCPQDAQLRRDCGQLLARLGRTREALVYLESSLELQPNQEASRRAGELLISTATGCDDANEAIDLLKRGSLHARAEATLLYSAAIELRKRAALREAQRICELALPLAQEPLDYLILLGELLFEQSEPEPAAKQFERALELRLDSVTALIGVSRAYMALKRWADAESALRRSAQLEPAKAEILSLLTQVLDQQGRADDAIAAQQRAVQASPTRVEEWLRLSQLLAAAGRHSECVQALESAQKLATENIEVLRHLGEAYERVGRFEDALTQAKRALALHDTDESALWFKGQALAKLGQLDEAILTWTRLWDLKSPRESLRADLTRVHQSRAERLESSEDFAAAAADYAAAEQYGGETVELRVSQARCLRRAGVLHEALSAARRSVELGGNKDSLIAVGQLEADLGRHSQACAAFEEALDWDPNDARAVAGLGLSLAELGRDSTAQQTLSKAIEHAPDARLFEAMAHVAERTKDYAGVAAALLRLQGYRPLTAKENRSLGAAFAAQQQFSKAADAYSDALELDADHVPSLVATGECCIRSGQAVDAISPLQKVLRLEPNHARVLSLLGQAQHDAQHYNDAIEALERQITRQSSEPDLELLAECWKATGREDKRAEVLAELARLRGEDWHAHIRVAEARIAAKQPDQAIASLKRAWTMGERDISREWLPRLLIDKAKSLVSGGSSAEAIETLGDCETCAQGQSEYLVELTRCLLDLNEKASALRVALAADAAASGQLDTILLVAKCYESIENWPQATETYSRAAEMKVDCLEAVLGSARCSLRLEQVREARLLLLRALQLNAQEPTAPELIIDSIGENEASEDCYRVLKELVQLLPNHATAKLATARVAARLGLAAESAVHYQAALTIDTSHAQWFVELARVLATLPRHEQSCEMALKALALDPNNSGALHALGLSQAELGRISDAIVTLERALAAASQAATEDRLARLYVLNASELEQQGNANAAAAAYSRSLKLRPDQREVRVKLAQALLTCRQAQAAIDVLKEGLTEEVEYLENWVLLGRIQQDLGVIEQAISAYRVAARFAPNRNDILEQLGLALAKAGQNDEAKAVLAQMASLGRASDVAVSELARLRERAGDVASAIADLDALAQARPLTQEEDRRLGLMLASSGNTERTFAVLGRVVKANAADVESTLAFVNAARRLGQLVQAATALESVVRAFPDRHDLALELGSLRAQLGQHAQAISVFEQLLSSGYATPQVYELLAQSVGQSGNASRQVEVLRARVQADPHSAQAHAELARSLAAVGALNEAILSYEQAQVLSPNLPTYAKESAQVLFEQAKRQSEASNESETVRLLSRAVELDPEFEKAWWVLAQCHLRASRQSAARTSLSKVLEVNPKHTGALLALSKDLAGAGELAGANDCLVRCIAVQPDQFDTQYLLGSNCLSLGAHERAVDAFRAALRLNSRSAAAWRSIGQAQWALGRPDEALASLDSALALEPLPLDLLKRLGLLRLGAKRYADAIEPFRDVCRREPNDIVAVMGLAQALAQCARDDEALATLDIGLSLEPQNILALRLKCQILVKLLRAQDAIQPLLLLTKLDPRADEYLKLSRCYSTIGDEQQRFLALSTVVQLAPDDAISQFEYGRVAVRLGHTSIAIDSMLRSIRLDPTQPALADFLLKTAWPEVQRLLGSNQAQKAVTLMQAVMAQVPNTIEMLCDYAVGLQMLGRMQEATAAAQRAVNQDPGHEAAVLLLGGTLMQHGQVALALAAYERAQQAQPRSIGIGTALARLYEQSGRAEEALELLGRLAQLDPSNLEVVIARGSALTRLGRVQDALETYRQGLERAPESVEILHRVGTLYCAQGWTDQGIELLQRALHQSPGHYMASVALAKTLMQSGKWQYAETTLKAALNRAPSDATLTELLEKVRWQNR